MSTEEVSNEKKIFRCSICNMEEEYAYYGINPPPNKHLSLLQDSYVMNDPFSHPKEKQVLVLGSNCNTCSKPVCSSSECSVFYDTRFCQPCAFKNIDSFPKQLHAKIINISTT